MVATNKACLDVCPTRLKVVRFVIDARNLLRVSSFLLLSQKLVTIKLKTKKRCNCWNLSTSGNVSLGTNKAEVIIEEKTQQKEKYNYWLRSTDSFKKASLSTDTCPGTVCEYSWQVSDTCLFPFISFLLKIKHTPLLETLGHVPII